MAQGAQVRGIPVVLTLLAFSVIGWLLIVLLIVAIVVLVRNLM